MREIFRLGKMVDNGKLGLWVKVGDGRCYEYSIKICKGCGKEKNVREGFYREKRNGDGRNAKCKACINIR